MGETTENPRSRKAHIKWDADLDNRLRTHWADKNLSATEIARLMEVGTRNAIIGRALRLGLERRGHETVRTPHRREVSRQLSTINAKAKARRKPPEDHPWANGAPKAPMEILFDTSAPATAVTLLDAKSDQCKWPFGDPRDGTFMYCGAKIEDGHHPSYCPLHSCMSSRSWMEQHRKRMVEERSAAPAPVAAPDHEGDVGGPVQRPGDFMQGGLHVT